MSLFSKISRFFGGNANTQKKGSQDSSPSNIVHENTVIVGVDGALQVSTVWACVSLLVETISSLPLVTYVSDPEGNRSVDKSLRIYNILHDSPNSRQTSQEFWEQMMLNYFFRGNAYARVLRDGKGEAIALWPLSSEQVEVIVADDGSLVYIYRFDNTELIYLESDILHIRGMGNGVIGLSRLDYMRSSVGLAVAAQNHTNKTFGKNARRPGVLMSDHMLNSDQRAKLKENFDDIVTGKDNELYILEAQFKFEALGMAPADIQLLETRKFSVEDLARWFGVPSVLINDASSTTTLGSSVGEIINGFHKLNLRPQLSRIEQAIKKRVLTSRQRAKNIEIEFNLDALLRASLGDRMEIYAKGVQNGIYSRNEPRKKENLPPYSGGEIFTAQSNLYPVDKLGEQQSTKPTPEKEIMQ